MTDRTTFEFLRGHKDGENRLFVKIFTGSAYFMVELDEGELADLRTKLSEPPTSFDGDDYGE